MASDRHARALSQRLLLHSASLSEFQVIGSTGRIYQICLDDTETICSCPDYENRHLPCKHIYFVLSRVLKVDFWKKGTDFSDAQLLELQMKIAELVNVQDEVVSEVRQRTREEQPECPICMDDLCDGEDITYCSLSCGYNFHKLCFIRCKKDTCPMCRTKMVIHSKSLKRKVF